MTLKEIFEYKKTIISKSMDNAFNQIFRNLDKDSEFELADDEMTELVYNLMKFYLKDQN